ncbi:sortase domain-containing protein [Staphylococcus hominis]|uniref:sortase domain-containing protein n=1 Tax=Staphylococcus hominis TaxID=1290 RepID=UPI003DA11A7D
MNLDRITLIVSIVISFVFVILGGFIVTGEVVRGLQSDKLKSQVVMSVERIEDGHTDAIEKMKSTRESVLKSGTKKQKENVEKVLDYIPKETFIEDAYTAYATPHIPMTTMKDVLNFSLSDGQTTKMYEDVIDNYGTGTIELPTINTRVPIIEGTTDDHLNVGVTTTKYGETIGRGDYVLTGLNIGYNGLFFSSLPNIKHGERVTINTYVNGERIQADYYVKKKIVTDKNDTSYINKNGLRRLVLVTNKDIKDDSKKLVVIAEKDEE